MSSIKPVLQHDFKDCGICCMAWLIAYYDGYIPLEKLREDTLTDKDGTNAFQIVHTFKKWGFDSRCILEHDLDSVNLSFPLIAHLHLSNGLEHFVIIKEIKKGTVYLMDPGIGYKKISLVNFNKYFTGYVILATPREKIIKMDHGTTINTLFFNILNKEKFLVIKIIIISLVWTIITIISSYYLKLGSNILGSNQEYLKYLIIIFSILTIYKVLLLFMREYYENHLSNLIDVSIYPEFIRHIFKIPLKHTKSRSTGEIITRISELGSIKTLITDIFISGTIDFLMLIVAIVILFFINKKLVLVLLMFILIYILQSLFVSQKVYEKVLENINYQTDFNSICVENINNLESVKNLFVTDIILKKTEIFLSKYLLNNYEFNRFINTTNMLKDYVIEASNLVINSLGFYLILKNKITIINLFTFNLIMSYFLNSLKNLMGIIPKYNYIKATFSKVSEFISISEEKLTDRKRILKGDIIFKNVSFSYDNFHSILNNISFHIKKGSHVLLDGASGTGKSTICHLIYKDELPSKGEILIDNENIKDIDLSITRQNILYVSQKEELFTGSIKENILLGRLVSDNYFNDICRICEIEDIVKKKSLRYDALIDASLNNLSGGEKQRIILARGLIKKANILILDEALSEVDKYLESKIIRNLQTYYHDKTIIYISHKNQKSLFQNIIKVGDKK